MATNVAISLAGEICERVSKLSISMSHLNAFPILFAVVLSSLKRYHFRITPRDDEGDHCVLIQFQKRQQSLRNDQNERTKKIADRICRRDVAAPFREIKESRSDSCSGKPVSICFAFVSADDGNSGQKRLIPYRLIPGRNIFSGIENELIGRFPRGPTEKARKLAVSEGHLLQRMRVRPGDGSGAGGTPQNRKMA